MDIAPVTGPSGDAAPSHLVALSRGGDLAAFERLYRQNVNRVYALCLRISGDPVRAHDLTQDAFVRAWENLNSFRGESAFSTWVYRLAINVALADRRSEERRTSRVTAVKDLSRLESPATPGTPGTPETGIDLERAIAALPPALRTVFVLHDVEGYPHQEIANLTGQTPATARVQLHRARKLLREALNR
ncbi:MAG: RNA polymerase sigma factor [Candidatus Latescibacteria bacterium]|nr:RNA polymerase sigma factor [Candidatus Latescibacterota bacterium]